MDCFCKKKKTKKQRLDRYTLDFETPISYTLDFESPISKLQNDLADLPEEFQKSFIDPLRDIAKAYARDKPAKASTPADGKKLTSAYEFVLEMPGVKPSEIKVQVEDGNLLVIVGERRRDEEKDEESECGMAKFMLKFSLPDNANLEAISAVCRDGVLTVTVQKLPQPEPKRPKKIEVKVA